MNPYEVVANNIKYRMSISETLATIVASNTIYLINKSGLRLKNGFVTLQLCPLQESIDMLHRKHQ